MEGDKFQVCSYTLHLRLSWPWHDTGKHMVTWWLFCSMHLMCELISCNSIKASKMFRWISLRKSQISFDHIFGFVTESTMFFLLFVCLPILMIVTHKLTILAKLSGKHFKCSKLYTHHSHQHFQFKFKTFEDVPLILLSYKIWKEILMLDAFWSLSCQEWQPNDLH